MLANFFSFKTKRYSAIILLVTILAVGFLLLSQSIHHQKEQQIHSRENYIFETSPNLNNEPIQTIPLERDFNFKKVALGNQLFHDPRLSGNSTISCASCHDLHRGGTTRAVVATGIGGQKGNINVPTVFNSAFNFKQFWDGRTDTLEEQIDFPLFSSTEMGSQNWSEIIKKLNQSPDYRRQFKSLYAEGISPETLKNAIATFERSLMTPNSRFDRFLLGDDRAISYKEKEGYQLFKSRGCASCHQGINIGGNMFQTLGLFGNYFQDRGNMTNADFGRYNVTKDMRDLYIFKVPSLRNVALTAPYFHDGSVPDLASAVKLMSKYQLGRELSETDIDAIVQFLLTLTGEYQGELLK